MDTNDDRDETLGGFAPADDVFEALESIPGVQDNHAERDEARARMEERDRHVAEAIASGRLEGVEPSPEFLDDAAEFVNGHIDAAELVARARRRWGLDEPGPAEPFVRGNERLHELLSRPEIAAGVAEVESSAANEESTRNNPSKSNAVGRSAAVEATSGSGADVFPDGYLDDLRTDWPGDAETLSILSNPDLVSDIKDGLADAEAGHVHSHDEVLSDQARRRAATGEPVRELDAEHGKPDPAPETREAHKVGRDANPDDPDRHDT